MPDDNQLDLVFDRHPRLGIVAVALTKDPEHVVTAVLRHTGFSYDADEKLYVADPRLSLPVAISRMQKAAIALGALDCTVRGSHAALVEVLGNEPVTDAQQRDKVDALAVFAKPAPIPAAQRGTRPAGAAPGAADAAPGTSPARTTSASRRTR
ncbi:hypothetical protein [Streptacidiphilus sp. MAP5-52]|uniref:hypothetical protein n=1 Tax=Streptacidiphilus sp. MAP5-52 TaxID=3156267 RepID=UPI0035159D90